MAELVLPNDANPLGNILGGKVMHLMDVAAAIVASRHARRPVVTVSVDGIEFHHPVKVGHVVHLTARVNHTGTTSMEVGVRVESENPLTGERLHTSSAFLTFVALDDHGRPTSVPPLEPKTASERRLFAEAAARRDERLRKHRVKPAPRSKTRAARKRGRS
jgi:acyl-CoA hydrolase